MKKIQISEYEELLPLIFKKKYYYHSLKMVCSVENDITLNQAIN